MLSVLILAIPWQLGNLPEGLSATVLVIEVDVAVGLSGSIAGVRQVADVPEGTVADLAGLTAVSGGASWKVGRRIWLGGGVSSMRFDDPFSATGERSTLGLEVRGRAEIELNASWGIDLVVRLGLDRWSDDGAGALGGWHGRFGVGGRYTVLDGLQVTGELAQWRGEAFARDGIFEERGSKPQPYGLGVWLLSVGVAVW